MSGIAKVFLVEDDAVTREALADRIAEAGYDLEAFPSADAALEALEARSVDIIVTDVRMPGTDGYDFLRRVKRERPEVLVLIITAYGTVEDAVEAMKRGAYDFLTKPVTGDQVLARLEEMVKFALTRSESIRVSREDASRRFVENVIGRSDAMRKAMEMVRVVRDIDATVLVVGETGAGKEVIARAIHSTGARRLEPFVPVSCAQLSRELLESELFGHERGAFTGAVRRKRGRFEAAGAGTVFLDDIDDVPLDLQVKLLRVLEDRSFQRVGGDEPLPVRCRVICAAKRPLIDAVKAGRFREDLYYRVNAVEIDLPPLRERRTDVPLLAEHFLALYSAHHARRSTRFGAGVMETLVAYDWPGNVRELENAVQRGVAFSEDEEVRLEHLPPAIREYASERSGRRAARPEEVVCLKLPASGKAGLADAIEELERRMIEWALARTGGSRSEASKLLGIPRTTLQHKMKRHGIAGSEP